MSREVAPIMLAYAEESERLEASELPQAKLLEHTRQIQGTHRSQLLEVMRRDPQSWPSLQAALIVCSIMADDSAESDKARLEANQILIDYHLNCPDLGALILANSQRFDDQITGQLCSAVLRKSASHEMRTAARIGMAIHYLKAVNLGTCATVKEIRTTRDRVSELATKIESESPEAKDFASQLRQWLAEERIGLLAGEIQGIDTADEAFSLSEFNGKVVLLDCFVDWCPWCKRTYAHNRDLARRYENRPFAMIGVSGDNQKILERLVNDKKVTWRCWADGPQGPIASQWGVSSYPYLVLIDYNGIVRRRFFGSPDEKQLDDAIEQLIVEAETDRDY